MGDRDFEHRLNRLRTNLDETAALLRSCGESHWLEWCNRCLNELAVFDASAFDHILRVFGGMGSFNDLVVTHRNSHDIDRDKEGEVNDRLWALREAIWEDATFLRQKLRS